MTDSRPLRPASRSAYTAIVNDRPGARDPFIIGRADTSVVGYTPCPQYGSFNSYDAATERAHALNAALGLSSKDAWLIIASTL